MSEKEETVKFSKKELVEMLEELEKIKRELKET